MFRLLFFTAGLLSSAISVAQGVNRQQLNAYLQALQQQERFMGNVVIYEKNKQIYRYNGGMADIATQAKLSDSTLFRIGSVTKTYTATLILKAIEEKKLSLTQTIDKFFPALPQATKITVQQLLNHHSGVANFTNSDGFGEWAMDARTGDELLARIIAGGSDFEPGTKGEYSNSNYVLLSLLLQQVYQKPYRAILEEKIITPLRLKNTEFGPSPDSKKVKASGYIFDTEWKTKSFTHLSIPSGAGAIVTTADDLALFVSALFQPKIITAKSLALMETITDGYGLGLFRQVVGGDTVYTHDGVIDGFYSFYYYFPKKDLVYVFLANARNYDLKKINETVFRAIAGESIDIPVFNAFKVTAEMLQQYAGTYTSEQAPLIITISNKDNTLLAHPMGQQVYTMEAVSEHVFNHEATGVSLEFKPAEKQMILKQGAQKLLFTRKE